MWRIGPYDPMIWGLNDLMIQIISRHCSKWPISRTMSPGTTTAITVLECVTGGSWSLATKSSVLCSPGNSYWAKWAQNRHWFMFFSIFWQIRLRRRKIHLQNYQSKNKTHSAGLKWLLMGKSYSWDLYSLSYKEYFWKIDLVEVAWCKLASLRRLQITAICSDGTALVKMVHFLIMLFLASPCLTQPNSLLTQPNTIPSWPNRYGIHHLWVWLPFAILWFLSLKSKFSGLTFCEVCSCSGLTKDHGHLL